MNHDIGWTLVRVVFGANLALLHGYAKVFGGGAGRLAGTVADWGLPAPHFFAWAASLSEFVGGILVAVGLATRPAAALCALTMLGALYRHRVDPYARMELALLYLAVMVAAMLYGSGRYGLDRYIRVRLPFQSKGSAA